MPAADHPNFHELPTTMPIGQSPAAPLFAPIVPQPPTTLHIAAAPANPPAANTKHGPAPTDHSNTARSGVFRRIINMGASLLGRSYESESEIPHSKALLTPRTPENKVTGTTGTIDKPVKKPTTGGVGGVQAPVNDAKGQTPVQGSPKAPAKGAIPYKRMAANAKKIPPPAAVAVKGALATRTAMIKKSPATVKRFDTLFAAY
jgi:hypothetical protein